MNKVSWKEHAELLKDLSMNAAKDGDISRLKVLHNIGATFSSEECDIAIKNSHYECVKYIARHLINYGKYEKYIKDICSILEDETYLECLTYLPHKNAMRSIWSYYNYKYYSNQKGGRKEEE